MSRGRVRVVVAAFLVAGALVAGAGLTLRHRVRQALEPRVSGARPLQLVPLPRPESPLPTWAGPEIEAVAFPGGELMTAGASGVLGARGDLTPGLPSRRASALALWADRPVVALEAGGLAVSRGGAWEELRSGWGTLHGRALLETEAGELLVGAREGLFRVAAGGSSLERLDAHPVRAVAIGHGFVLAGGERGLVRIQAGRAFAVETPDPWIQSVAVIADTAFAVTAVGLARGPLHGPLVPVRGCEAVVQAVSLDGRLWAAADPPAASVRVFEPSGAGRELPAPAVVRRLMTAAGLLFVDTANGLFRRDQDGWRLVPTPHDALPQGSAHVTALARFRGRLVAGLFDGGLVTADTESDRLRWTTVPGTEAWGINALLVAGGDLWVASLRGAARFDGARLRAITGPGAAFSLAATREGVAIGYGQGVLLPGSTLLSAFHGLPGNQALALAEADALYVGTPSGLGALAGRRVLWRTTAGEGKLAHPWVTALVPEEAGLLVGTWGGGLVRRRAGGSASGPRADAARYEPFVETEGLQVSPGALALADGRAWVGTDADGLWRESRDGARFERVPLPLPSSRVTALLAEPGVLWVGTDQGVVRVPVEAAQ